MSNQARVFITQQPRPNKAGWTPNLGPASNYGSFVYIFPGDAKPWCNPDEAMEQASEVLHSFDPDKDFILWPNSGDPCALWVTLLVLARFPINKIRFLYWERKLEHGERSKTDGFYSPVQINLNL